MARSVSDRHALDAIAARLNKRRHPNDIAAALLLLITIQDRVRETGRRVPRHRRPPFRRVPKVEQQLREAVRRCLTHDYELGPISAIVLDVYYGMLALPVPAPELVEETARGARHVPPEARPGARSRGAR